MSSGTYRLGKLTSTAAAGRPDLLAPAVRAELEATRLGGDVGVVEIDPDLSDTAQTQRAYDLPVEALANCVVVGGKRAGEERVAGCVVLADSRADVNTTVKRRLDVRKASFMPMESAVEASGMEYGAITPVGLPTQWSLLVDSRVVESDLIVLGSGIRSSKLLLPGRMLTLLPRIEVVVGLGGQMRS
ncbi:MAG: YbaK/EbsC family protein [Nocardioidaceae bacterium]